MTVGIISYMSQRGLGTMCHDLRQQLGIQYQLVVPDHPWPMHLPWANGEEFYLSQWEIQKYDLDAWQTTDGIDTVISIETGFGDRTFQYAKELGMKTILIVMWEAFNPNLLAYRNVDLYVCPSNKAYQEVPFDNKVLLPYPVDTNLFKFREITGPARTFVHNAGSGGMNGRKGTLETVQAFVKARPWELGCTLHLRSQVELSPEVAAVVAGCPDIIVDPFHHDNREDLYGDPGDVLIYPSKYDGHALVTLEGMASGMPVITTDAEPMNEFWAQGDALAAKVKERVPAGLVNPHCYANIVDTDDLARLIRWCATHTDLSEISRANRAIVEKSHSWTVLRDRWKRKLGL